MPNFEFWELAVFVIIASTLFLGPWLILRHAFPIAIKEIRRIWQDADPNDNTHDR